MSVSESQNLSGGYLKRLGALLTTQLRQGLQPRQITLALAVGATIGVLPVIWGTSVICCLLAYGLRLNQAIVQLANYLVFPLQILLFIPYLQGGEKLFSTDLLPTNPESFLEQIQTSPWEFIQQFWQINLQAAAVWLITTPLLFLSLFFLSFVLVSRLSR